MKRYLRSPLILVFGCAILAPYILSEYHLSLLNYIGLYSIVALGLILMTGVGGLTSFVQAAFVGIGAYTTAVISSSLVLSPWLGLISGMVITVLVAAILGLLTLRLSGHYLPIGTLAWGLSIYYLFGSMPLLGG